MDFGLARDLYGDRSQSGMLIGSPAYWSPEQAHGERATERSDIYAVGVIACELFGAQRPSFGHPGPLMEVPPTFRPVIRRCLAVEPAGRFSSAAALRDALVVAARALPARRRLRWAAFAGMTLIIAAAASYSFLVIFSGDPTADFSIDAGLAVVEPTPAAMPIGPEDDPGDPGLDAGRGTAHREAAATAPLAADLPPRVARPRDRRRPRPWRRPVNKTDAAPPPDARATQPAADSAVPADRMIAAARTRLAAIEKSRRAREIMVDDLRGYRGLLQGARQALAVGDAGAADAKAAQLSAIIRSARIDGAFVSAKLSRLNRALASRKLDKAAAAEVRASFSRVHAKYFAGDYMAANRHLNAIWGLLQRAGQ
jgi:hypothetical protein